MPKETGSGLRSDETLKVVMNRPWDDDRFKNSSSLILAPHQSSFEEIIQLRKFQAGLIQSVVAEATSGHACFSECQLKFRRPQQAQRVGFA